MKDEYLNIFVMASLQIDTRQYNMRSPRVTVDIIRIRLLRYRYE